MLNNKFVIKNTFKDKHLRYLIFHNKNLNTSNILGKKN